MHDIQHDAFRVAPVSFELERKVRPKRVSGRFIRSVMAEIFWFF
jgi:hypothetical protein